MIACRWCKKMNNVGGVVQNGPVQAENGQIQVEDGMDQDINDDGLDAVDLGENEWRAWWWWFFGSRIKCSRRGIRLANWKLHMKHFHSFFNIYLQVAHIWSYHILIFWYFIYFMIYHMIVLYDISNTDFFGNFFTFILFLSMIVFVDYNYELLKAWLWVKSIKKAQVINSILKHFVLYDFTIWYTLWEKFS